MTTMQSIARLSAAIAALLEDIRYANADELPSLRAELSRLRSALANLQANT